MQNELLEKISNGRTDLVFDFFKNGSANDQGELNSLIKWCAYYGDVSAIRFLQVNGIALNELGENLDLNGAAFHGHWQLCQFLIENGAHVNFPLKETGETPLHSALCKAYSLKHDQVVKVLLAAGANPNSTISNKTETGSFMRDCRTRGETPLHRAAAFASEDTIQLLLSAGAQLDAKDANGDSPLTWASWYLRPASVLKKLCYGKFKIHPDYTSMEQNLIGKAIINKDTNK